MIDGHIPSRRLAVAPESAFSVKIGLKGGDFRQIDGRVNQKLTLLFR
jgi:hypothetical protein